MLVCQVDTETLSKCESAALTRNIDLLQRVAPDTPLPNSNWTAHDAAAHLVTMIGRYVNPDTKLAESPSDVERLNAQAMQEFASATMAELVGRLRSRHAKYAAFWQEMTELPLEMILPIRSGRLPLDVAGLRTNWISELLIHGRDIAVAAGEEWPLDDASSLLTMRLLAQVLPSYLHPIGLDDYALVVAPDGGAAFSIVVTDGAAEIRDSATDGADGLAGSPGALVLLLYGRTDLAQSQTDGVRVAGEVDRVQRFLDRLDRP